MSTFQNLTNATAASPETIPENDGTFPGRRLSYDLQQKTRGDAMKKPKVTIGISDLKKILAGVQSDDESRRADAKEMLAHFVREVAEWERETPENLAEWLMEPLGWCGRKAGR